MISGFFLDLIYGFIQFLINLLPAGATFPVAWVSGVNTIWNAVNSFSFIVPVATLTTALSIAISFHLFIFAWKGLHWIYGLIRGSQMH